MPLRAAIIGGGITGLLSIKQCLEDGIEPVCFEASGHIGGQWHYAESDPETGEVASSMYRSVVINTSREGMMMSDFPMNPKEYAVYPHNTKVLQYFKSYADFFGLHPHIRLNHRVQRAFPNEDGRWTVEVLFDGSAFSDTYDAVLVCVGHHSKPNIPAWKDLDEFQGEVIHSHNYRDTTKYVGRDVAVIGVGNSGADISAELSTCTRSTHLITRSGAWIFPRFLLGQPYENIGTRFNMTFLPRFLAIALTQWLMRFALGATPEELKPKHNCLGAHPTIRSDLFEKIRTGTITPHRGSVKKFTRNGIVLSNGEVVEPLDAVIASTGYILHHPFLPKETFQAAGQDVNWVNLYRLVTPPEFPGLYFIGLCQPLGALMPVAEMQTRWVTALMKDEIKVPSQEEMQKDIAMYQEYTKKRFVKSPRHTLEVDFFPYLDMLARDIGAQVTFPRFLSTLGLWGGLKAAWSVYFGPPCAAHYRFFGKGRKEELARLVCERTAADLIRHSSAEELAQLERYRAHYS